MSIMKLKGNELRPLTAEQFFTDICPKLLDARRDLSGRIGGKYSFSVHGPRGGGYTLDLDDWRVLPWSTPGAALELITSDERFEALLTGAFVVEDTGLVEGVWLQGDPKALGQLLAVMAPSS